jgi:hypothetical protein
MIICCWSFFLDIYLYYQSASYCTIFLIFLQSQWNRSYLRLVTIVIVPHQKSVRNSCTKIYLPTTVYLAWWKKHLFLALVVCVFICSSLNINFGKYCRITKMCTYFICSNLPSVILFKISEFFAQRYFFPL